jgi:DNA polymerase-3 subunit gamma/tau
VPAEPSPTPAAAAAPLEAAPPAPPAAGDQQGDLTRVREGWEQVLARLGADSRVAWTAFHTAMPVTLTGGTLAVAVAEAGNVRAIAQRGHDERLRQALIDVLGLDVSIDVLHDPGAAGGSSSAPAQGASAAPAPATPRGPAEPPADTTAAPPSAPRRTTGPGSARGAELVRAAAQSRAAGEAEPADQPSEDDPDLSGADGVALLTRELGARPVGEIDHS